MAKTKEKRLGPRNKEIIERRISGESLRSIGRRYGLSHSAVAKIEREHIDWVEERRLSIVMLILGKLPDAVEAQLKIASDPNHPRAHDAFRELAKVVFPRMSQVHIRALMQALVTHQEN